MNELIFEIRDKVAYIKLNRPDKFNSVNKPLALELQRVLDICKEDENIRAVYLTGEGKAFCAGQDLGEIVDPNGPPLDEIVAFHYNPVVLKIRNLPKPVVAGVNGVAAGAGANIALACDVVVAHESATFIQAFSKIGLIPDSGGTYTLPRLVGLGKASALMMLGDKVPASDAERMGMIYKVFQADDFESESFKIAQTLADMPTLGLAYTKALLNKSYNNDMATQLAEEHEYQIKAGQTEDYDEGVKAFLDKRKAQFKGK